MITNWEDIKDSSFIQNEGAYTFKVKSCDTTGLTNNGDTKHVYECVTEDGESIRLTLPLSDKALFRYKQFATACGLNTKSGAVDFATLPDTIIGKKFIGEVKATESTSPITMETKTYYNIATFKSIV